MTKKRFRLGMAALGLLAAFFMALIGILLAPTMASANKDGGNHHGGVPTAGYALGGPGGAGGAGHGSPAGEEWNSFGHLHDDAHDAPLCVEDGVYPCAIIGGDGDAFGGDPGSYEAGYPGGGTPGANGSPHDHYTTQHWGYGGGAGGGSGGGAGGGGNNAGPGDSEKHADKSGDESDRGIL